MGCDVTDRAHTRLLRHVLQLGVLVALALPHAARGDVDPGGLWSVTVDVSFFGNPVTVAVTFQRSGNTLDAYVQNLGNSPLSFPSHLAGSIDPVTGAFTATGDSACLGAFGAAPQTIAGTFGPAGDVLTGTADFDFTFGAPLKCFRAVGTASGTRTSVTCGNGLPDAGEACEFDSALPGCCTLDCQPRPAGSPCRLGDALCSLQPIFCGGCGIGRCDGAGACLQTPRPAGTSCRAATNDCDVAETCDGVSTECPADEIVPPPDSDGDGLNDGCDPCTGGALATKPRLKASRLTSAANRLAARATLSLTDLAALDPVAHGVRLIVSDGAGLRNVNATAPGGSGWKVTGSGWSFRGDGPLTSVKLKRVKSPPGAIVVTLRGRDAWFFDPPPEANLPLEATIVLDPPFATTGLCGVLAFPGPPRVQPACALQRDGSSVSCR